MTKIDLTSHLKEPNATSVISLYVPDDGNKRSLTILACCLQSLGLEAENSNLLSISHGWELRESGLLKPKATETSRKGETWRGVYKTKHSHPGLSSREVPEMIKVHTSWE